MTSNQSYFKSVRKALNLNQKDYAKLLGLSQPQVSMIETGKREPSQEMLEDLVSWEGTEYFKTSIPTEYHDLFECDPSDDVTVNTPQDRDASISPLETRIVENFKGDTKSKLDTIPRESQLRGEGIPLIEKKKSPISKFINLFSIFNFLKKKG